MWGCGGVGCGCVWGGGGVAVYCANTSVYPHGEPRPCDARGANKETGALP